MKKECILYDRECINCGECDMCDLDPKKKCNNCGACIETEDDYSTVDVDLTFEEGDEPELLSFEELFPDKAFGGGRSQEANDNSEDEDFAEEDDYEDFDDFDDSDNFYDDEDFEYADKENDESLKRDFGELF